MAGITREYLESLIESVKYSVKGKRTRCTLTVMGLKIEGDSYCAAESPMNKVVGEKVAYENAISSLRQHEHYAALRNCK